MQCSSGPAGARNTLALADLDWSIPTCATVLALVLKGGVALPAAPRLSANPDIFPNLI